MSEDRVLLGWLYSERKAKEDLKQAFSEAEARNLELATELENVTKKVDELQDSVQRLEEKLSISESENQAFQIELEEAKAQENAKQQEVEALKASLQSERDAADNLKMAFSEAEARNSELATELETATRIADQLLKESEEKAHKSLNEKQQELLVKCISQNLGYDGGKPVAACVIYRCLLHWKSFGDETTTVFDCIIEAIGSAVEDPNNNEILAYWLSNSAILLLLLHRILRETGSSSLERLLARMALVEFMENPGNPIVGQGVTKLDDLRLVEAKDPAVLFKQQLSAFLEKAYGMIRDNLKKNIAIILIFFILGPNDAVQQGLIPNWQIIREILNEYLDLMKANNAPPFLVRKLFTQVFSFINVELFNSVLRRREYCSFRKGEYVKAGLDELEQWCVEATEEYAGSAWDELRHIRQAVGFMLIREKPEMTLTEIARERCPGLSIKQLSRICNMYWDEKYGTYNVSSDALANLDVRIDDLYDVSYILDYDSSIPFSVESLSESVKQVDVYDIDPPQLLRQNSGFEFLLPRREDSPS